MICEFEALFPHENILFSEKVSHIDISNPTGVFKGEKDDGLTFAVDMSHLFESGLKYDCNNRKISNTYTSININANSTSKDVGGIGFSQVQIMQLAA